MSEMQPGRCASTFLTGRGDRDVFGGTGSPGGLSKKRGIFGSENVLLAERHAIDAAPDHFVINGGDLLGVGLDRPQTAKAVFFAILRVPIPLENLAEKPLLSRAWIFHGGLEWAGTLARRHADDERS